MPNCKYCGTWSGLFDREHLACAELASAGKTPGEIRRAVAAQSSTPPRQVTPTSIFWSVFLALLAFAILAGILGAILRA